MKIRQLLRYPSIDLVAWFEKFLSWKRFWRKFLNCKHWLQIETQGTIQEQSSFT